VRIGVSQFRRHSTIDRHVEVVRTIEGRPIRVSVASKAGADQGAWRGEFDASSSKLSVFAADNPKAVVVPIPADVQLPDRLFGALSPLWKRSALNLTITYLDPAHAQPAQLEAIAATDAADGESVKIETQVKGSRSTHRESLWFDPQGNLLRLEQPFFGAVLTWSPCAMTCDRAIDDPFDPMARLTVRSPFRIPASASKGTIRYVIARVDEAEPRLIATSEQSVVRNGHRSIVTVCDDCGSDASPAAIEESYVAPNAWVQSAHPEIRSFARRAAGSGSVDHRMRRLTEAVRARMTGQIDFLGYASALEALRSHSGDCTEIAVLLAAVARAESIPARVVIGLVYADRFSGKKDVFSPHAWVQAWDGEQWTSYDAALDGFDATHIAMAIGNGDPLQFEDTFAQLAKWRIENAGAIKTR